MPLWRYMDGREGGDKPKVCFVSNIFCGQDAFFFRLQQQKVQSDDTNRYLSMYVSHWRKSIKFHIPFLYNIQARRDMIGTND